MSNTILHALEKLSQTSQARLLLEMPSAWVVLHSYPHPHTALCEVATNSYLPSENQIDTAKEESICSYGYTWRRGKRSLGKIVSLSPLEERVLLYEELRHLFASIYEQNIDHVRITFVANNHSGLQNGEFTKLMRDLSRKRTHDVRLQVYQSFLNASFLLAVDQNDIPIEVDRLGSLPCFAVFTDDKSIRCWDPRGCLFKQCYGFEVIRILYAYDVGSLLINPKGDISGELYKNELQTLAKAIRIPKISE